MRDNDRRFTLPSTIAEIKATYGLEAFDLDPCADTLSQQAPNCLFDEGLTRPWFGHAFVNPPFSDIETWVRKALKELPNTKSITLLLPANRTEQPWFWILWRFTQGVGRLHNFHWFGKRTKFGTPEDPEGKRKGNHPPFACFALHLPGGVK